MKSIITLITSLLLAGSALAQTDSITQSVINTIKRNMSFGNIQVLPSIPKELQGQFVFVGGIKGNPQYFITGHIYNDSPAPMVVGSIEANTIILQGTRYPVLSVVSYVDGKIAQCYTITTSGDEKGDTMTFRLVAPLRNTETFNYRYGVWVEYNHSHVVYDTSWTATTFMQ